MTDEQILEQAIRKALDRNWDMYDHDKWSWGIVNKPSQTESYHYFVRVWLGDLQHFIDISHILFDHDFAKALWGEEPGYIVRVIKPNDNQLVGRGVSLWQAHLTQMVIADDPIKYLGEHL